MPLVKKTDQFPERPVVILLVGTPFSRKTSLANTAKTPILIDADRGADRSYNRPDTYVMSEGWEGLEAEDSQGLFNGYETAILDTAKAILDDFLVEFVIKKNIRLKTNKMQMYGAIGDEFKLFVNKRRASNMDIIVISHDKTKDDDGTPVVNPDITGGSKNLILRIADQVGFVSNKVINELNVVTINFQPSEQAPFCKNVANLPELVLPHYSSPEWKGYMDRMIIQPTKDAISKMTDEQRSAISFIEDWQNKVDTIAPGELLPTQTELANTMGEISVIEPEHLKKQVRAYFSAHLKKIDWKYDAKEKQFVPVNQKAEVKPDEPAPVVSEKESVESNPSGLTAPEDDLFKNQEA